MSRVKKFFNSFTTEGKIILAISSVCFVAGVIMHRYLGVFFAVVSVIAVCISCREVSHE